VRRQRQRPAQASCLPLRTGIAVSQNQCRSSPNGGWVHRLVSARGPSPDRRSISNLINVSGEHYQVIVTVHQLSAIQLWSRSRSAVLA
jgi:hypothetical protein